MIIKKIQDGIHNVLENWNCMRLEEIVKSGNYKNLKRKDELRIRTFMLDNLVLEKNVNTIYISENKKIVIPYHAWEMARRAGYTKLKTVLENRVRTKTFIALFAMCNICNHVEVSSLWRPGQGSTHNTGNGIDIIKIGNHVSARSKTIAINPGYEKLKNRIWETGLFSQWIGPWKIRGDRLATNWISNSARYQGDKRAPLIHRTHVDHIHLSVKV